MRLKTALLSLFSAFVVFATAADVRYDGARFYSLDPDNPNPSAVCVNDQGRFVRLSECQAEEIVDLTGSVVIPGFIEGHGHLMGFGQSLTNLDLSGAESLQALVDDVAQAIDEAEPGDWILGRGWHQSKWSKTPKLIKGFQTNETLNQVSPENPVYLVHASGHAAFANDKALELAGVTGRTQVTGDGEIILDASGKPTGILNEVAQALVEPIIPRDSAEQRERQLQLALQALAANGITSFHDAGATDADIALYQAFLAAGAMTTRVYVMITGSDPEMLAGWMRRGPLIGAGDQRLTVRSLKLVADGALGSRGAWLIEPYTDRPGHIGLPTLPIADIIDISHLAYRNGFQVAVHAIGDRANREVLDVFDALFDGRDRGVRYRVEHAQHIDPVDIPRFAQLGIIPSVQGIHMSSDRPWAIDRLGQKRIEQGAYMWRDLIDTGAILVNGTDVPVEPVNPFASFYALVTRQTLAGDPEGGFEPGQKISRAEALRAYTLNAAYAAFEEQEKGSLSPGKLADFVVLDRDIMTIPADEILATRVLTTYVSGEVVYQYLQTEALVKVER